MPAGTGRRKKSTTNVNLERLDMLDYIVLGEYQDSERISALPMKV